MLLRDGGIAEWWMCCRGKDFYQGMEKVRKASMGEAGDVGGRYLNISLCQVSNIAWVKETQARNNVHI